MGVAHDEGFDGGGPGWVVTGNSGGCAWRLVPSRLALVLGWSGAFAFPGPGGVSVVGGGTGEGGSRGSFGPEPRGKLGGEVSLVGADEGVGRWDLGWEIRVDDWLAQGSGGVDAAQELALFDEEKGVDDLPGLVVDPEGVVGDGVLLFKEGRLKLLRVLVEEGSGKEVLAEVAKPTDEGVEFDEVLGDGRHFS